MKTGIELIAEERKRQIGGKKFTSEHDYHHKKGEMAKAAACYALPKGVIRTGRVFIWRAAFWPWEKKWWKPNVDRIRELQKAGALIAAEIDRILAKNQDNNSVKNDSVRFRPKEIDKCW